MSQEDVDEDDTDTVQCLTRKIISTCNKDVQSRVENDENLKITKRTLFFTSWYILSVYISHSICFEPPLSQQQVRMLGTIDRQQKQYCDCVATLRYNFFSGAVRSRYTHIS